MEENIECGDFIFFNNFDSANLAKVEKVDNSKADNTEKSENNKTIKNKSQSECPSDEFNLWTKQDCQGTEFQNNNRTWFYFGIKSAIPGIYVKLNLVNLNKQLKMFNQGMSPVYKVIPGHPHWERIKEKPTISGDEKSNEFILSFIYKTSENSNAITYFAFTYPFSYTDLQNYLKRIDTKMLKRIGNVADDIYYHKECAIKSLEGRRLDVLTISSFYNILPEREAKIKGLYPEQDEKRPYKFKDKKVIFLSARVHPGETPSSFVLNGFLNFILNREEPIAIILRRLYVFKLIPMLNPDGVSHGYYRMDTKGVNLNRLYLNPSKSEHPTIYAAKTLLRYYHNGYSLLDDPVPESINKKNIGTYNSTSCINSNPKEDKTFKKVNTISYDENQKSSEHGNHIQNYLAPVAEKSMQCLENQSNCSDNVGNIEGMTISSTGNVKQSSNDSGIFLYIDFHGHASKKGIFMYGNHFNDPEEAADCMLLPKLMSLNNPNFHFTSCNFAEKNMYLIDKRDGLSREGSGRVAVYKLTGMIYSYTLECNYNTGRLVNTIPPRIKEGLQKCHNQLFVPPKYTPMVFEEVGAALGPSILDMTGNNPNSRIPNSHYRSLKALQAYLKLISASNYQATMSKPLHKVNLSDTENDTIGVNDVTNDEIRQCVLC
ncbi:PREDICTED: cytosolic carboxypeptidase-like protein 5 [Ceratosolen solmsi marchali]|uniref:tubulin-glutamate carboxypeptidase n=1 Tax=Ceratosolen solmsi marchali TaxID=326594 RepID=A0AAJ6YLL9_9HYME|nr:PREDICTED: cytosolic carboxypeptidase-like protein 5 [Ceratosolen solmsi marchali]